MHIFLFLVLGLLTQACDTSVLVDDRKVPIIPPSEAPFDITQIQPTPLPAIPGDLFTIETTAGTTEAGFSGDNGPAANAKFSVPLGLAFDSADNLYIADRNNNRIRRISPQGTIATVAGGGFGEGDGPALEVRLFWPVDVAFDPQGRLHILEERNNQVRRLETDGQLVSIVGGNPPAKAEQFLDQPQAAAQTLLNGPQGIDFDGAGNLYVVDTVHGRIRRVTPDGQISTLAGTGHAHFAGDGLAALGAQMNYPSDVSVTPTGEIVVADRFSHRLRRINREGIIFTIAGNESIGYSGDDVRANTTSLFAPYSLDVAGDESVFFTDTNNNLVRKILPDGIIKTIAGCPTNLCLEQITAALLLEARGSQLKQGVSVGLDQPRGLALSKNGEVYFSESNRIHKLTPIQGTEEELRKIQPKAAPLPVAQ